MTIAFGEWTIGLNGDGAPGRELIGGKAWSVARMQELGLNVPPAFVVTTRACAAFLAGHATPPGLEGEIAAALGWLEERTGRRFGFGPRPLLVSVRSGAAVSMPGMMDTVLNLGINDETEAALAEECGDLAFARNTHRRFLELYAHVVLKAARPPSMKAPVRMPGARPSPPHLGTRFRANRRNSCAAPCARYSNPGTPGAPEDIASTTAFRTILGPP